MEGQPPACMAAAAYRPVYDLKYVVIIIIFRPTSTKPQAEILKLNIIIKSERHDNIIA